MAVKSSSGDTLAMRKQAVMDGTRRADVGNTGKDKHDGDKIGPGTFADDGAEPAKVRRGAPPKPVKRYSLAD